jgi:ATP-dependent DNA helicase RecQ
MLFEISGLRGPPSEVPEFVANTFAVLTRGAPTRPSPKLQQLMFLHREKHSNEWDSLSREALFLVGDGHRMWDQTIRGAPDGYNPALEFFDAILPIQLPEWAVIQQLIIPEFPLFRRLGAPGNLLSDENDEQVDFYLPQADLVIEIDGGTHRETRQAWKDRNRDRFLEQFGILTLRLNTQDLRAENDAFNEFFSKLRTRCEESSRLEPYRRFIADRKHSEASLRYDLTAIIRFQMALMLAIAHRQLDPTKPEWRLNVSQDFAERSGPSWVAAAIDELFDWFALFARLSHLDFVPPRIVFGEDGLKFDVGLFSRPDDDTWRAAGITIRTSAVQDLPFALDDKRPPTTTRVPDYGISYLTPREEPVATDKPPSIIDLTELCRRVFGHDSFRPGQESLILNALSGQRSLGLMPTGSGKSLCFQLPALLKPGTTIIIVPIKALGRDHCAELEAAGFTGRVVNIDSDMPVTLRDKVYTGRILRGEMRFVFVSPERFQVSSFRDTVRGLRMHNQLRMFVIDEVHCMSEWGHDFRPSYLTLPGTLRELADDVSVLGLTATASVNVLRDIQAEFHIPDELVAYEMHRSRSELSFSVRKELSTATQIETEVAEIVASGEGNLPPPIHIFARYANGVLGVQTYATMLGNSRLGLRVGSFSGTTPEKFEPAAAFKLLQNPGVPKPETFGDYKRTVQELWKAGQLDVIVTTKAFGMGVNKPDVRHTLHAGMPGSMEAFYQEAGRAGRDRKPAFCHMLLRPEPDEAESIYTKLRKDLTPKTIAEALEKKSDGSPLHRNHRGDFRAQLWFLSQGLISVDEEQALVARLHDVLRRSVGETVTIRAGQIADLPHGSQRLQLTLYRLYQMGIVAPWAVTDWGRGEGEDAAVQSVEVRKLPTNFVEACSTIAGRIQAIDGKSAGLSTLEQVETLSTGEEDWQALYRLLLTWVRRKHLDSRLQSTWNLYSKSMAFTPDRATAFRDELEAFFKVDSNAFQLAALRDMTQEDVVTTLEELICGPGNGELKEQAALRKLYAQLSRLLEGTQDSPGLNLAAASLLLLTEDAPGIEARQRFRAAVPKGALFLWHEGGGRKLLALVASSGPLAREMIGEWLVEEKPDRQQLLAIHETIPARAVEAALLDELAAEMALTI